MSLEEHRDRIDAIDQQVVALLNERAQHALAIGKIKEDRAAPFYVPEREREVFARLQAVNAGPLPNNALAVIWREIMSAVRALEKPTSVAFLGPRDTFSHLAARRVFGVSADYHPMASFADIFTEVERKRVDYGIVPIESATGGSVGETLDRFVTSDVKVCNEVLLHVTQNLLSRSPLAEIGTVYSKDNALFQCRNWLRANLPAAQLREVSSTAEAARRAAGEPGTAAIASRMAAETYQLDIVCARIEDHPHNYTRFFVIGHQPVKPTGDDKTAIMVAGRNRAGELLTLLQPFAEAGINLSKIESRPSRTKAWQYVFFIDFDGHVTDEPVQAVLQHLEDRALTVKILGSFPRAEMTE